MDAEVSRLLDQLDFERKAAEERKQMQRDVDLANKALQVILGPILIIDVNVPNSSESFRIPQWFRLLWYVLTITMT